MAAFDPEILELLGDGGSSGDSPLPTGRRVSVGSGRDMAIAGDAYEGASQLSRELAAWNPVLRSADADILPVKNRVDARSLDTSRNDAYVAGAANIHRDNIVGSLFMLTASPSSIVLFGKEDTKWEDEFSEEVGEKFTLWAESADNWPDASRKTTLTGLVRMAVGIHTYRGEVLASVEWLRDKDEIRPFNTAIQMIDLDRLSTPPDRAGDKTVRAGIKFNSYGAPVGYFVRLGHPRDYLQPQSYQWKFVPIRKPWGRMQMLHIFDQTREHQSRGIAQMVSALKEMRMTKNFRDIVLQNAVVNATYAASIESDLPTQDIFNRLGGSDVPPEKVQEALTAYMVGHYTTLSQFMGGAKNLAVNNVKIPHLPPGSKLQLRGAGQGGPLGTDFEQSLLRNIAAALDVSYEQLSRDYTRTNYSSARAAMGETWKAMQARKRMVADRFATHVYRLWLEEALNNGLIDSIKRRMPSWYEGQNADAYSNCSWIGASRGQIDELKETQAAVLRINNGLSSIEQEAARLGIDWRKLMRQLAREKEWKKFYDILQDQSGGQDMMNAASGSPRKVGDGEKDAGEPDDDE